MKYLRKISTFLLGGSFFCLIACTDSFMTQEPGTDNMDNIKIGLLVPLTGSLQAKGPGRRQAVQMALDEINASGKVLNRQLELVVADDGTSSDKALSEAQKLLDQEVVSLIGPTTSGSFLKVAQSLTILKDIVSIAPSATSPEITDIADNNLLWRTPPSDAFQGKVAAQNIFKEQKKTNAAVLYVNNSYGKGLANAFKEEFTKLGGTISSFIDYPDLSDNDVEAFDFKFKADELLKEKPDVIFMVTYLKDGAKFTFAAKTHISDTYKPLFVGCDGNKGKDFILNGEPSIVEGMIGTLPKPSESSINHQNFIKNYKAKYNQEPVSFAANAYDALYLTVYAILQAGKADSQSIAANLKSVSSEGEVININEFAKASELIKKGVDINYEGASGNVDFDNNGDVSSGTYEIWKVENKEFITLKAINYP